ncbi:NADP oxidoreductase [Sedimenticola selenatireducens]|uniref:NADH-quinone oxidoreductase subunit B family protein n=1 Tax=Sedimenticola selenatireducens TaxID=191960 RepID=UPI002AAC0C4D|nr:NADP oxidoreductase [Sedimenticola selenatireducens]
MADKIRIATASLAGCFGCHMSLLDIDECLIDLVAHIEFDRTPLTDIKQIGRCDVGLIEGGVCNAENVEVLKEFRRHCNLLVAVGACAINGGIPAMRNQYSLTECLEEAYLHGSGIDQPQIPNDPELPLLLDQVHPIHDVVWIDYFLPGCPPSADTIFTFLDELLSGKPIQFAYRQIHYD